MDRCNAAVEHTLPQGAPIGQQEREFSRTSGLRWAWTTRFAECRKYPILGFRKRGLSCEHRFLSFSYS